MHWHRLSTCDTFSRPEKALGRHEELTECWYLRPEATTSYNITQPGLHLGWIKSSNLGSGIIMDQNPKNPDISRFEFPNSSSSSTILQYLIQPIDVYHPWTSRWTELRGSDHGSSRKSSISAEDEVLPAAPTQHQLPPAATSCHEISCSARKRKHSLPIKRGSADAGPGPKIMRYLW